MKNSCFAPTHPNQIINSALVLIYCHYSGPGSIMNSLRQSCYEFIIDNPLFLANLPRLLALQWDSFLFDTQVQETATGRRNDERAMIFITPREKIEYT